MKKGPWIIGLAEIAKYMPFGYKALCLRVKQLKEAGVLLGPRHFGSPRNGHRRLMYYTSERLIEQFFLDHPTF